MDRHPYILGCLLGTAVGDAARLRREGLTRRRAERMYGRTPIRPELAFGRGFYSDDTEHTQMVGYTIAVSNGEPAEFERQLARQFRRWLLTIPIGVGFATLRACLKLVFGFSPTRSGVFSAGNGPAMRSALLGVVADSDEHLQQLVHASTHLTHTDPRAEVGALLIARAARLRVAGDNKDPIRFIADAAQEASGGELQRSLSETAEALSSNWTCSEFAESQNWSAGVSGYANQTVPAALFCWARSPNDLRQCVENAISLGGDTDSVGAIVGAICGSNLGAAAVPDDWLCRLAEWPRSAEWMGRLATALATMGDERSPPPPMRWAATLPRNALVGCIVIALGFRRLLPPY